MPNNRNDMTERNLKLCMKTDLDCITYDDHANQFFIVIMIVGSVMLFLLLIIGCVNYKISKIQQDINDIKEFPEYKYYLELLEKSKNQTDYNIESVVKSPETFISKVGRR